MPDVFGSFISPLLAIFNSDEERASQIVSRLKPDLDHYTDDVLKRAVDNLLRKHQARTFPSFAHCLDAVHEAAAQSPNAPRAFKRETAAEKYLKGQKIAAKVCLGPMVAEAWKERWFGGLWDFCAKEHRMPNPAEVAKIKPRSQETRGILEAEAAGDGNLSKLARSMLARYRRLANEQIGKS